MMHRIRKSRVTIRECEQNAEYTNYQNRLDNLSNYLRASSEALNVSEQSWKEVCNAQKTFAGQFVNRYPDSDQIRDFGKRSATASQSLVKEFVLKTDGSQAEHWQVDAVVQEYLAEIARIQAQYEKVTDKHKEVQLYTTKMDDLQKAKKLDEAKIARNMKKLEEAENAYQETLERVVECMTEVYSKRQVALKATYVAYWSSQLRAFRMLDESLDATRAFVQGSISKFKTLKIESMTPADVEAFIASNDGTSAKPVATSPIDDSAAPPAPAATVI